VEGLSTTLQALLQFLLVTIACHHRRIRRGGRREVAGTYRCLFNAFWTRVAGLATPTTTTTLPLPSLPAQCEPIQDSDEDSIL